MEHFNRLISCLLQAPKACKPSPLGRFSEVLYQLHSIKGVLSQPGGNFLVFRYVLRLANLSPLHLEECNEDCHWAVLQKLKGNKKQKTKKPLKPFFPST